MINAENIYSFYYVGNLINGYFSYTPINEKTNIKYFYDVENNKFYSYRKHSSAWENTKFKVSDNKNLESIINEIKIIHREKIIKKILD